MSRIFLSLATAVALGLGWIASTPAAPVAEEKATIDVVLCLDVSGSMNGLIESAKLKLWDIVNDLGKVKPAPNLRVGLYSYGHTQYDANAGWVRKEIDLTNDLDSVYQKLNALTINGGSEYVARVTRDAIQDQKWSEGKKALKMIFVCGNEPASQDPTLKLADIARKAIDKNIIVNTIFCGPVNNPQSADWKEFAKLAEGRFASIDQNQNVLASIQTPHDKALNELSAKLNSTYVVYGGKKAQEAQQNQFAQDANANKAAPGAGAARAISKGSALYRNDAWDLVDRLKNDKDFDVKKIPVEELCDEMKKMTPEEREKHVKEMAAKREDLQKQIATLAQKRDAFIKEEAKKNPNPADRAFDEAIRGTLRDQASKQGIKIPD
jgi:DNA-binding transcriptional MerR regulator